jgi:cation/acetate symporter
VASVRAGYREVGKVYSLLAVAFALFVIVVAMLAQYGLPDPVTAVLVVSVTVAGYAVIGIVARTLSLADFFVAGRAVPAGFNGMATGAAFITAAGFIGIAGAFFASQAAGLAVAVGWLGGFIVLAVAVAPYYRKSGAVTLPDLLAVRFGNPLVRILGVVVLVVVSLPLLAASIAMASHVAAAALHIGPDLATGATCVIVLLCSLLGGMRAVTLVAGAQAIVILFGTVAPSLVFSLQQYGLPIPQLTYGNAIADAAAIATAPVGFLSSSVFPVSSLDGFNLFALALCIAAGVASLPHILARSSTTTGIAETRVSVAWALVVVAVVAATAPAIAAFVRLAIVGEAVGVEGADLPQWLFDYSAIGLIKVCGAHVATVADISAACGASAVVNGLAPGDIGIGAEGIALGFADIASVPYVLTALIAAAVLAAALGAAGAVVITLATSIAHDVYGTMIDRRAAGGRRLIVARVALLGFVAIAAWMAVTDPGDTFALAFAAPSLAAAGFFPAVVLGIWWRRTTFWGAALGMIAGFGATAAYVLMLQAGAIAPLHVVGLTKTGISGAAAAIFGLPLGFAVTVIVSLMTPEPSAARLEVVDAIRRPNPDPVLEDHAV